MHHHQTINIKKGLSVSVIAIALFASMGFSEWKKEAVTSFNISNTYLDNWTEGGEDAITWNIKGNGKLEQDLVKHNWTQQGKVGFGQTKLGSSTFRKSLDEIFFESLYRYKLTTLLNPYSAATLQTQWTSGYQYTDTSRTRVSDFWDPGYLTQSVGMGLSPLPTLITRLGFSIKESFSSEFAWADDKATTKKEDVLVEPGLESITTYSTKFNDILKYDTKLSAFVNFKGVEEIDGKWENMLVAKVAKYLSFQAGLTVLYDYNLSKDTQIKQDLSVGLTYSLF